MINKDLKETLNEKIQKGKFQSADFSNYFKVFCQLGSNIEDLQDEVISWDRKIQIDMAESGSYWISIAGGNFTTGKGQIEDAHLILFTTADMAAKIFSGEEDGEAAFTSGKLKIQGDLADAIKFQELLGLVIEEIEN